MSLVPFTPPPPRPGPLLHPHLHYLYCCILRQGPCFLLHLPVTLDEGAVRDQVQLQHELLRALLLFLNSLLHLNLLVLGEGDITG
jgi:hypothetical protein